MSDKVVSARGSHVSDNEIVLGSMKVKCGVRKGLSQPCPFKDNVIGLQGDLNDNEVNGGDRGGG